MAGTYKRLQRGIVGESGGASTPTARQITVNYGGRSYHTTVPAWATTNTTTNTGTSNLNSYRGNLSIPSESNVDIGLAVPAGYKIKSVSISGRRSNTNLTDVKFIAMSRVGTTYTQLVNEVDVTSTAASTENFDIPVIDVEPFISSGMVMFYLRSAAAQTTTYYFYFNLTIVLEEIL